MNDSNTPALDAWNAQYSTPDGMFHEMERLREKARHDEAQALHNARRKEKIAIAQNLLKRLRPIDEIVADVGLSHADVEKLRDDIEVLSEIIGNMKKKHDTVEQMMQYTGLTREALFEFCSSIGIEPFMICTEDERARAMLRSQRKFQMDSASNLATVEDRGRAEGDAKARIAVAKKLIEMQMPIDKISDATDLARQDIKALLIKSFPERASSIIVRSPLAIFSMALTC